ncbi:ABC transporter permease [Clostridium oryzae]|uniref:FtsX-like permease family protein n=1 Tax=Clostridium oryzae TaxID=1450648 RepID=A0A1V4IX41_9CLOT|nr:ABC transporter permease [Clostridium oryzae]OPJ64618.1 FtsX-like permease family protein [Clostridium oryzae]
MKIINEYTLQQIKKNKRHTISILVAIVIASALLFSLCTFIYSYWQSKIAMTIAQTGNWHGELFDSIKGDKLQKVIDHPEVESAMVKGTWITAKLTNSKLPYLLIRDGDKNFWKDMNLKNTLTKGRLPEKDGEIVIAKQFFSDNPAYHIGDKLSLPVGKRMVGDKIVDVNDYKHDDETFLSTGSRTYTIVGMLDVSSLSAYPGYITMGYLDVNKIQANDELTVYMRLFHLGKIYEVLPELAKNTGLKQDTRGQYGIKYNTPLLSLYGISENHAVSAQMILIIAIVSILLLLVMGTFILIIYNAFSLSANSRIKELSILKSIGATPIQIKNSVLYEGFLLWLIQSPIGILVGLLFTKIIFSNMNRILSVTDNYKKMDLSFSWYVVMIALAISLITVLVSASIPARKMAKIPAVEGISQMTSGKKKLRDHKLLQKLFHIEGELAGRQFQANKKSLRTAIISLSLCFILIASYANIITIYQLAQSKNREITKYDMSLDLNLMDTPNQTMVKNILSIPEIKKSVVHRQVLVTTNVAATQQSDKFVAAGGFNSVDKNKYYVSKDKDNYKIEVCLVGLSDESFHSYCKQIGINASQYYKKENCRGILYDSTYHLAPGAKEIQKLPMLNLRKDSTLRLSEKVYDGTDGNYEFNAIVGDVTQKEPGALSMSRYSVALVFPMNKYKKIISNFNPERELEANRMTMDFIVGKDNSKMVKDKIYKICNTYVGSQDFSIWTLLEEQENEAIRQQAISVAIYAIALMFGIIGIFNAYSTISNNLQIHKRDYAMLRSVGLTPGGLNRMLFLEGLLFAFSPLLVSIPFIVLICWYMLKLTLISWNEYLAVFPGRTIFIYIGCMLLSIILAYAFSARSVKKGNIIETIQNQII